jgi:hypothetical protein
MIIHKIAEQIGENARGGRAYHNASCALSQAFHQVSSGIGNAFQNVIGVLKKDLSLTVENQSVARTLEKLYSQLLLQGGNGRRNGGRGNEKVLSGRGDFTRIRNGFKILQLIDIHALSPNKILRKDYHKKA